MSREYPRDIDAKIAANLRRRSASFPPWRLAQLRDRGGSSGRRRRFGVRAPLLANAPWRRLAERLLTAAKSARAPLTAFEGQLALALKAEGLIGTNKQAAADASRHAPARRAIRLIIRS